MRSFALAVVGLAAVSHALPTGEASGLNERQSFQIGEPGQLFYPGNENPAAPVPSPETTFQISPRDKFWLPDSSKSDKDNIAEAEIKLQDAEQALSDCDDDHESWELKKYIKQLERYLKQKAGITSISSPPGTTTTFTPGKRDAATIKMVDTYTQLAAQYKDKHPSLAVYLILMQMQGLLASEGCLPENVIFLGPVTSTLTISTKRQIFGVGGSCEPDEIASLLFTYSSLQQVYGPHPSTQIRSLENAIITALKYCNTDPVTGTINPDPTTTGGSIQPDPSHSGSPLVPNKPQTGSPLVPSS